MPKFIVEQIAICPRLPAAAIHLLKDLGLRDWVHDVVAAHGTVFDDPGENVAMLAFNYEASSAKPLELEVLNYTHGPNWMMRSPNTVSHLGMHVTEEELAEFDKTFKEHGIKIAQEVFTDSHTNPAIKDSRRYHYRIYDTRRLLSVDLKFIVRRDI
jgi:hypothetical protein